MRTENITKQNFQGKASYIRGKYDYPASKEIEKAVKQLNNMNIIKNNDFNIFIKSHRDSLMVTAAKTKHEAEHYGFDYKSPKATSINILSKIISDKKIVPIPNNNKD